MTSLHDEIRSFRTTKLQETENAHQLVALRLAMGIDLSTVLAMDDVERKAVIIRLERILERERLKGARRHWSYDLNRHIALRQVLLRLRPLHAHAGTASRRNENGARRRR